MAKRLQVVLFACLSISLTTIAVQALHLVSRHDQWNGQAMDLHSKSDYHSNSDNKMKTRRAVVDYESDDEGYEKDADGLLSNMEESLRAPVVAGLETDTGDPDRKFLTLDEKFKLLNPGPGVRRSRPIPRMDQRSLDGMLIRRKRRHSPRYEKRKAVMRTDGDSDNAFTVNMSDRSIQTEGRASKAVEFSKPSGISSTGVFRRGSRQPDKGHKGGWGKIQEEHQQGYRDGDFLRISLGKDVEVGSHQKKVDVRLNATLLSGIPDVPFLSSRKKRIALPLPVAFPIPEGHKERRGQHAKAVVKRHNSPVIGSTEHLFASATTKNRRHSPVTHGEFEPKELAEGEGGRHGKEMFVRLNASLLPNTRELPTLLSTRTRRAFPIIFPVLIPLPGYGRRPKRKRLADGGGELREASMPDDRPQSPGIEDELGVSTTLPRAPTSTSIPEAKDQPSGRLKFFKTLITSVKRTEKWGRDKAKPKALGVDSDIYPKNSDILAVTGRNNENDRVRKARDVYHSDVARDHGQGGVRVSVVQSPRNLMNILPKLDDVLITIKRESDNLKQKALTLRKRLHYALLAKALFPVTTTTNVEVPHHDEHEAKQPEVHHDHHGDDDDDDEDDDEDDDDDDDDDEEVAKSHVPDKPLRTVVRDFGDTVASTPHRVVVHVKNNEGAVGNSLARLSDDLRELTEKLHAYEMIKGQYRIPIAVGKSSAEDHPGEDHPGEDHREEDHQEEDHHDEDHHDEDHHKEDHHKEDHHKMDHHQGAAETLEKRKNAHAEVKEDIDAKKHHDDDEDDDNDDGDEDDDRKDKDEEEEDDDDDSPEDDEDDKKKGDHDEDKDVTKKIKEMVQSRLRRSVKCHTGSAHCGADGIRYAFAGSRHDLPKITASDVSRFFNLLLKKAPLPMPTISSQSFQAKSDRPFVGKANRLDNITSKSHTGLADDGGKNKSQKEENHAIYATKGKSTPVAKDVDGVTGQFLHNGIKNAKNTSERVFHNGIKNIKNISKHVLHNGIKNTKNTSGKFLHKDIKNINNVSWYALHSGIKNAKNTSGQLLNNGIKNPSVHGLRNSVKNTESRTNISQDATLPTNFTTLVANVVNSTSDFKTNDTTTTRRVLKSAMRPSTVVQSIPEIEWQLQRLDRVLERDLHNLVLVSRRLSPSSDDKHQPNLDTWLFDQLLRSKEGVKANHHDNENGSIRCKILSSGKRHRHTRLYPFSRMKIVCRTGGKVVLVQPMLIANRHGHHFKSPCSRSHRCGHWNKHRRGKLVWSLPPFMRLSTDKRWYVNLRNIDKRRLHRRCRYPRRWPWCECVIRGLGHRREFEESLERGLSSELQKAFRQLVSEYQYEKKKRCQRKKDPLHRLLCLRQSRFKFIFSGKELPRHLVEDYLGVRWNGRLRCMFPASSNRHLHPDVADAILVPSSRVRGDYRKTFINRHLRNGGAEGGDKTTSRHGYDIPAIFLGGRGYGDFQAGPANGIKINVNDGHIDGLSGNKIVSIHKRAAAIGHLEAVTKREKYMELDFKGLIEMIPKSKREVKLEEELRKELPLRKKRRSDPVEKAKEAKASTRSKTKKKETDLSRLLRQVKLRQRREAVNRDDNGGNEVKDQGNRGEEIPVNVTDDTSILDKELLRRMDSYEGTQGRNARSLENVIMPNITQTAPQKPVELPKRGYSLINASATTDVTFSKGHATLARSKREAPKKVAPRGRTSAVLDQSDNDTESVFEAAFKKLERAQYEVRRAKVLDDPEGAKNDELYSMSREADYWMSKANDATWGTLSSNPSRDKTRHTLQYLTEGDEGLTKADIDHLLNIHDPVKKLDNIRVKRESKSGATKQLSDSKNHQTLSALFASDVEPEVMKRKAAQIQKILNDKTAQIQKILNDKTAQIQKVLDNKAAKKPEVLNHKTAKKKPKVRNHNADDGQISNYRDGDDRSAATRIRGFVNARLAGSGKVVISTHHADKEKTRVRSGFLEMHSVLDGSRVTTDHGPRGKHSRHKKGIDGQQPKGSKAKERPGYYDKLNVKFNARLRRRGDLEVKTRQLTDTKDNEDNDDDDDDDADDENDKGEEEEGEEEEEDDDDDDDDEEEGEGAGEGNEDKDETEDDQDIEVDDNGHKQEPEEAYAFVEKPSIAAKFKQKEFSWGQWSSCSTSCGLGQRFRSNLCGQGQGQVCTGKDASTEMEVCDGGNQQGC